jgi:hypothetical protein
VSGRLNIADITGTSAGGVSSAVAVALRTHSASVAAARNGLSHSSYNPDQGRAILSYGVLPTAASPVRSIAGSTVASSSTMVGGTGLKSYSMGAADLRANSPASMPSGWTPTPSAASSPANRFSYDAPATGMQSKSPPASGSLSGYTRNSQQRTSGSRDMTMVTECYSKTEGSLQTISPRKVRVDDASSEQQLEVDADDDIMPLHPFSLDPSSTAPKGLLKEKRSYDTLEMSATPTENQTGSLMSSRRCSAYADPALSARTINSGVRTGSNRSVVHNSSRLIHAPPAVSMLRTSINSQVEAGTAAVSSS